MSTERTKKPTKPASAKAKVIKVANPKNSSSGRPARLSRQAVLDKSIELLDKGSVDSFTLAKVAQGLDTVSMALYNYFPSRADLLKAVADHISLQFKMPKIKADQTWQETLRTWLWAFKKHAERYPVIFKVMGVDGQTSAGWLRVTVTVGKTLQAEGMEGPKLAMNTWLFCSNAIALVQAELMARNYRAPFSLAHLDELEPDEQNFFLMIRQHHTNISTSHLLEEGFNQLIRNLEFELQEIAQQKASSRKKA
jgi:AcrR family transcriptional regulator